MYINRYIYIHVYDHFKFMSIKQNIKLKEKY